MTRDTPIFGSVAVFGRAQGQKTSLHFCNLYPNDKGHGIATEAEIICGFVLVVVAGVSPVNDGELLQPRTAASTASLPARELSIPALPVFSFFGSQASSRSQDAKLRACLEDQSRCPNFTFFVWRYFSLCGFASTRIGTCSTISNPYPSRPTTFLGLFVRKRNCRTPRSNKICAPRP